ncbi:hypothetical protein EPJ67_04650 [Brachyspira aalborgi]|uniref:Uncharacterized protein n=1 Tax=Brachyspira aalborgi TaxID=29522 RepID=A0A5C8G6Q4_9SPIR|nr:hypothetical protein [Brachyspira aalborgi]TXJ57419.1 hypothetical protein EPJ67_04650 [Brachyspira aalborgi]
MDSGGYNGDVSVINKRRGDNSAQNGLVEYTIEPKPEIKKIFEEGGMPTPSFNQLKKNDNKAIDTFKNAIAKAKQSLGGYGASVELKDDYTDINLYLSEDGESGFGIKPNGDIVSVFSNNKAEGGRSHYMLEMATAEGGRQLDCFDIYLTKIYEAHGFKPVAKMKWNDEYIPEGWKAKARMLRKDNFKDYNNGEPALTAGRRHVVFMVYDPNNDIEKKKKEAEEKYGKKNEIPYIVDYDMGEDAQHMYKWRSPAEREAIYNNMLERYKNAKTTEELKKVFSNSDKPFLRQMDDLNSLSKEQVQSIQAEYSKRYLELIKEENPEEYKKHKKYLERKYNIKSDASIYIDSLIDIIEYIDAKKKEFREEDGKFAKKGSSSNKSKDATSGQTPNDKIKDKKENDKKDNDIEITDNDRYEYLANVYARMHGYEDNKLLDAEENAIRKNILGDKEKVKAIDNDIKYSRGLEKSDKDKYNKYKEYKETAEYKEKMKKAINQFEGDTKATAEKLYSENLKAGELVLNKDGELDEAKINKLNIVEKGIHFFTEDCDNRNKKGFTSIKKKVKDLINKSIPKEISLYRHETIYESDERYNFEVGKTIKMDVRSFCNSENAFDSCRALQLWNNAPHKDVIFKIEGEVKSLEIESLSEYTNQKEHLVNGNFVITDIREATLTMPKIITIKAV